MTEQNTQQQNIKTNTNPNPNMPPTPYTPRTLPQHPTRIAPLPAFPSFSTPRPLPSQRHLYNIPPTPQSPTIPIEDITTNNNMSHSTHDIQQLPVIIEINNEHKNNNNIQNEQQYDDTNANIETNNENNIENNTQNNIYSTSEEQYNKHIIMMEQQLQQMKQCLESTQRYAADLEIKQSYYTGMHNMNNNMNPPSLSSNSYVSSIAKFLKPPEHFSGDRDNGKQNNIDSWISQMRNFLFLSGIPPCYHVQLTGTFFTGAAAEWFTYLTIEDRSRMVNFEVLATMLLQNFRPIDMATDARTRLAKIIQTGAIAKFNNLFLSIVQRLPTMDMEEKIHYYRSKLKHEIQYALISTSYDTLNDIMKAAVRTEALLNQQRPHSLTSYASVPRRMNNEHVPSAVQVNNTNISQQSNLNSIEQQEQQVMQLNYIAPSRMTDAERQRCRELHLCFRCRKPGHGSTNCPTFTTNKPFRPSTDISSKKY